MKKNILFLSAGLMALGIAAPASAADLGTRVYSKAPPMVAAIYDWSGLYVGVNGGGGWSRFPGDHTPIPGNDYGDDRVKGSGGTFGGQIGYRWQLSNWVFGVEGQGNWADFSASETVNRADLGPGGVETDRVRTNSFGLFTGQVGYAWNNVLLYVKGGAAVVNNKYDLRSANAAGPVATAWADDTSWGGTVGVGLDVGFAPNWSVGVEWNHIFQSGHDVTFNSVDATGPISDKGRATRQDIDMALVRLNYRFGGPVVARY